MADAAGYTWTRTWGAVYLIAVNQALHQHWDAAPLINKKKQDKKCWLNATKVRLSNVVARPLLEYLYTGYEQVRCQECSRMKKWPDGRTTASKISKLEGVVKCD